MASRVTVIDVAQRAGVSKTTAAAILNGTPGFRAADDTRRRVTDAAHALGYQYNAVAAALSSGRTHAVGVQLPSPRREDPTQTARHSFRQDMFMAIFMAAHKAGLRVMPIPAGPDRSAALNDLNDRRIDGVILVSATDEDFVERVYASGLPCVEVGSGFGDRLIQADNEAGAGTAIDHLVSLGHRRIAYWQSENPKGFAAKRREAGFRAAMERHGLSGSQAIFADAPQARTALTRPAAERPTALFAYNDLVAAEAIDVAREVGLELPRELSIVGFDNSALADATRPRLTTIHNPLDDMADAAVRLLIAQWRGETLQTVGRVIPAPLIIRDSSVPPPGD